MDFYFSPLSTNGRKVAFVLNSLGLEANRKPLDFSLGEHRSDAFLAINPNGMVPALVDGDVTLFESNAIMSYLCSKKDTGLWPTSPARYDILQWMCWQLAHWGPACDAIAVEYVIKPVLFGAEPDPAKVEEGLKSFHRFAAVLETSLGDGFLVGKELTLADIAIAASLTWADTCKLPLADYPKLFAHHERMNAISEWAATAPRLEV